MALVRSHSFRTSRAWAIARTLMLLFDYTYLGVAEKRLREWFGWARRSRLEPIKKVAKIIHSHWSNIQ